MGDASMEKPESVQKRQFSVFGLPKCALRTNDLYSYFTRVAQVQNVILNRRKGFATVTLYYESSVDFVLGEKWILNGSSLTLRRKTCTAGTENNTKPRHITTSQTNQKKTTYHSTCTTKTYTQFKKDASEFWQDVPHKNIVKKKKRKHKKTHCNIIRTDKNRKRRNNLRKKDKRRNLDKRNNPRQHNNKKPKCKNNPEKHTTGTCKNSVPIYIHSRKKYLINTTSFDDIKRQIQEEEGIPALLQLILYKGKLLIPEDMCKIEKFDFLQVFVRGKGGMEAGGAHCSDETPKCGRQLSHTFTTRKKVITEIPEDFIFPGKNVTFGAAIGEGACSRVYVGKCGSSETKVALKTYKLHKSIPKYKEMLRKEANCLLRLKHENIVKFLGVCLDEMTIILEYAQKSIIVDDQVVQCNNLRQVIDIFEEDLPDEIALESVIQVTRGMLYLHEQNIIHADIKSLNVLVSSSEDDEDSWIFKLTDLGEAHSVLNTTYQTQTSLSVRNRRVGTLPYLAPEVLQGEPASKASDIYSFGMILYELSSPTSSYPWALESKGNEDFIKKNVISGKRPKLENETKKWSNLMKKCWNQNPQQRPSFKDINMCVTDIVKSNDFNLSTNNVLEDDLNSGSQDTEQLLTLSSDLPKIAPATNKSKMVQKPGVRRKLLIESKDVEEDFFTASPQNKTVKLCESITLDKISNDDDDDDDEDSEIFNTQSKFFVPLTPNHDKFLFDCKSEKKNAQILLNNFKTPQKTDYNIPWTPPPMPSLCFQDTPRPVRTNPTCTAVNSPKPTGTFENQPDSSLQLLLPDTSHTKPSCNQPLSPSEISVLSVPNEQDVMKWSGYALKYFGITKLHQFQIEALNAYQKHKDVLVVRSTSGGKSLCYHLPASMLKEDEMILVISPTVALAQDQYNHLHEKGIKTCLLGSMAEKTSYDSVFANVSQTPQVLIVTPETLMGGNMHKGIKDKLYNAYHSYHINLKLIAIDEAHLIWDWGGSFREAYNRLNQLKDIFKDVPIMALTATLPLESQEKMITDILRKPVVLKSSIDRANVSINIMTYDPPQDNKGTWDKVSCQIQELIGKEKAIIYCSFAKTCDAVCSSLLQLGLVASAYTGGTRTTEEKKVILENMCKADIQVLVATQAFGLGINIPWIRFVIHLGCPPNIPLWVQELGRAGRDGKPAKSIILFKEYSDTQKLKFWTTAGDSERKMQDFVNMWQYIYTALNGECLREHQMTYFGEKGTTLGKQCCTGCEIKDTIEFIDLTKEIKIVISTLKEIQSHGLKCITEKKLLAYLFGKEKGKDCEWLSKFSISREQLEKSECFGSLSDKSHMYLKGIVRQLVAKNWIKLVFLESKIQGGRFTVIQRFLSVDEEFNVESVKNHEMLPDPEKVWTHIFSNVNVDIQQKSKSQSQTHKKGSRLSFIKNQLESQDWEPLETKDQYVYLGFPYSKKFLFTNDLTKVPGCPIMNKRDHFIWNDISFGKGSGYPNKIMDIRINDTLVRVKIQRNDCQGVQKCSISDCNYAISNRHKDNRCLRHEEGTLIKTGPCNGTFIYVHPIDTSDRRRWIGFLNKNTDINEGHNHPCPILWKPSSQLEEMIENCVKKDPTKTAAEMAKGYGLPCLPAAVSALGARKQTLATLRSKYITNLGNASAIQTLKSFNSLIKNQVDEEDIKFMESKERQEKIKLYTENYLYQWNQTNENDLTAWFMSPQMAEVFSLSHFVEADVTFPGCKVLKYMLNIAAYNPLLLKWQVVGRVMMTKLTAKAYSQAFRVMLNNVTKLHPEFEFGKNIKVWTVDFSDAQAKALESIDEGQTSHQIRGCKVHFMRAVHRIAEKVSSNVDEKNLFIKIANHITEVEEFSHVKTLFDMLCLNTQFSVIDSSVMNLNETEKKMECTGWKAAKKWVDWWLRPRHTKMICVSATDISKTHWELSPATTNAVESQNRISVISKITSLHAHLVHIYRTDRSVAFESISAEEGLSFGLEKDKQLKKKTAKRKWRSKQTGFIAQELEENDTNSKKTKASDPLEENNDMVGKKVLIDTNGPRGKHYGYLPATIVEFQDEKYKAVYDDWPDHFASFEQIDDKEVILLAQKE